MIEAYLLSLFKKFINIIDTVNNILFLQRFDCLIDDGLIAIRDLSRELLNTQHFELLLHLGEGALDGIQVGAITQIKQSLYMQVLHRIPGFLGCMSCKVVHENAELGVSVNFPEFGEVLLELRNVHRLREQHIQFLSLFSRYARKQSHRRFVGLGLIDVQVLLWQAVFALW